MQRARAAWGRTALIGSTGFVGGVLSRDVAFDAAYASATIEQIEHQAFDTVICAGAPAVMWRANADPDGDRRNLETLVRSLTRARIERLVLISTIAVLADPAAGADETTADFETQLACGRNRRWLETTLSDHFQTVILRLPALYGPGLKKNFLFDLRHPVPAFLKPEAYAGLRARLAGPALDALDAVFARDAVSGLMTLDRIALAQHPARDLMAEALIAAEVDAPGFTHPDSQFQFYGLNDLADHIDAAVRLGLDALHLAVEPWPAGGLSERLTGRSLRSADAPLRKEDMRTCHSAAFGGAGPYLRSRGQVLDGILRAWEAGEW